MEPQQNLAEWKDCYVDSLAPLPNDAGLIG